MSCLSCVGIFSALVAIALKIYIKLNTKWNNSYTCLKGKTVIVTGSNAGLGYETALNLAMRGARVIMACRSKERSEEARKKIVSLTGNENVVVKLLNLESFKSIREFCEDVNKNEERLDILVNNAGIVYGGNKKTEDGLVGIYQTNHFGPFLLTHLLIDKLKKSAPSRIVNVSSYFAKSGNFNIDQLDEYPNISELQAANLAYSNTKLCNLFTTIELAKKLEGSGVTVLAAHPGATRTDIISGMNSYMKVIFDAIRALYFWTPTEGAQCQIYCAVEKNLEMHNGELFGNCRRIEMYENATDVVLRKAVWRKSEDVTKLEENEKL